MHLEISTGANRNIVWFLLLVFFVLSPSGVSASVLGEARFLMRSPRDLNADGFLSNAAGELP